MNNSDYLKKAFLIIDERTDHLVTDIISEIKNLSDEYIINPTFDTAWDCYCHVCQHGPSFHEALFEEHFTCFCEKKSKNISKFRPQLTFLIRKNDLYSI